jgi:hypothetical protein
VSVDRANAGSGFALDRPAGRAAWFALDLERRRAVLLRGDRRAYVAARDWATELITEGRAEAALVVLEDLLAVAERTPFARADVLRALRRLRPPLDVQPARIRAHVEAALRDVRQRPAVLRVVPDLLRYAAQVQFALGDQDGVVECAELARTRGSRLARGFGGGPLERIRDDAVLAPMWAHPGYRQVFAHLPPPLFTDAAVAVSVAEHVRHVRLNRPVRLPVGMDRLVGVETVELEGAGDASTLAWLWWLAGRPSLHTLELTGAAQRLVADEDLLAALLVAPGLRRLRIGYPSVNPWSMRVLLAELRRSGVPPRTRLLHLALLRDDLDYVVSRARTADLVAALDSGVAGVRSAALHLLDGVLGAPAVRFEPGDEVLVAGRLRDGPVLAELVERFGLRLVQRPSPRTRLAVIAELHGGAAVELLDGGLPLICEGQVRAMLEAALPLGGRGSGPVDVAALGTGVPRARVPAVSRALASTDGARVGAELARLTSARTHSGAFEGLIVVATNPRLDRSLRQAARRLLLRDAPADLVDAVEDVADVVRVLDRSGVLSTWDLQETGVETDGLVDVVELAVLLMSVRRNARAHRLDVVRAGLTRLPDGVGELQHLRRLRLDDNRLADLPAAVLALRGLRDLSLAGNRLAALPDGLAALGALASLDLGHNRFADLPAVVGRLYTLRRLDVTVDVRAGPARWPGLVDGLAGLPDLRELVLDGHELAELPPGVLAMAGLERLSLRHGRLGTLPQWLTDLPRLGMLTLDGTAIDTADAALDVLAALRKQGTAVSAWPTEGGRTGG